MLSKHAHKIYLKKNTYAIFNNLVFEPIIVSKQDVINIWNNNLNNYSNKEIKTLYESGILIHDKNQDTIAKNELVNTYNNLKDEINLLYIIPDGGCNLACKYCFIGEIKNKESLRMSTQTADYIVEKFTQHIKKRKIKKPSVIFYGGEPTLNFKIIKYIVSLFESKKVPISFSIITNGTCLTDEMILFFKNHKIMIGVSIDGPKKVNDINRIYKNSLKGSFDAVIANIKKLKEKDIQLGLSTTLSNEVLNQPDFLNWLISLGIKNINFNLLHYTSPNEEWKIYYPKVSKFLFKAHKIFQKHDIKEDRVLRKFRAFYINRFKFNDCSAVGAQQLAISPNGNISICHAYWNNSIQKCGNINSCNFEDVFRTKTYKNWKHNLTVNKKQCLKCPAIYICGGGCPKQAADMFNNINGIDKPFCIHTKHSLKELLKELINKPTS